ncbi:MAG: hypothetical protein ABL867_02545 [Rickettsiales bacterium]
MSNPLILSTNKKPTMFNQEMAIGFLINPIIGTIVGGIIGKKRMEHELAEGKIVREPTAVNKSALLGGLIGAAVAGVINAGIMMATIATETISTSGIVTAAMIPAAATATTSIAALLLPALAIAATAITIGSYIGGQMGKKTQAAEYAQAVQQYNEQKTNLSPSHSLEQAYEQNVGKNHVAEILKERALAQAKQKQM